MIWVKYTILTEGTLFAKGNRDADKIMAIGIDADSKLYFKRDAVGLSQTLTSTDTMS